MFCAVGNTANPCILEIVEMENGVPTQEVLGQKYIDMSTVVLDTWHAVDFDLPVWLTDDREFGFRILSDNPTHSLRYAELGGFDTNMQK